MVRATMASAVVESFFETLKAALIRRRKGVVAK
jgi:hypothetical protein